MDNKQYIKALTGKTGKDIIRLVRKNNPTEKNIEPPASEMEIILSNMWKELLGHSNFGVNGDFFALGGNSLKATQLISRITRSFRKQVHLEDIFHSPTIRQQVALVSQRARIGQLQQVKIRESGGKTPLSFSQKGLWVIDRLLGTAQYHLAVQLSFQGELHPTTLEKALAKLIDRHEVLKTVIREEEGKPYQLIKTEDAWRMTFTRMASLPDALDSHIHDLINHPYDLATDYMVRAELFELQEKAYLLVIVIHHIAADGWSLPIFARELTEMYNALGENRTPALEELPLQYADYAVWQQEYMKGERLPDLLSYWGKKLENVPVLNLPSDFPRPPVLGIAGASAYFNIDHELHQKLVNLSQQEEVTLFMTLLSVFYILLYRYSNQEDISVGCPMGNRALPETEALIGFFVNTLALRTQLSDSMSFKDLLQLVKQTAIDAYMHQDAPFEKIVEQLVGNRVRDRSPLFQVVFLLQNTQAISDLQLGNAKMNVKPIKQSAVQFELEFSLQEKQDGLLLRIEYSTELYSLATINRMAEHYTELLKSVVQYPMSGISDCRMMTEQEEKQLLMQSGLY